MNESIVSSLVCPQTGSSLELKDGELYSENTSYPLFNDIPWLFSNPELSFLDWGTKITNFIAAEARTIKYLSLLRQAEESKLTEKRLKKIQEAKETNLAIFQQKLQDFLGHKQIKLTPSKQQIYSYFQLIFRDWSWESTENDTYFNFIKDNTTLNPKKILVLGAGACGLSYKIANHFKDAQVIATDHNPFLFFMAHDILSEKPISLTDYTFFPKSLSSTTHQWNIKTDAAKNKNHHMVLADYPKLPFKEDSFDMIIAPWFFDILEDSYPTALFHSLKYLKQDGELFQVGPANIHTKDIHEQLTSDEQTEIYKNFFSAVYSEQKQVRYLDNPIESQTRTEEIIFLKGLNKKSPDKPFQINNNSQNIKLTDDLQEYKVYVETLNKVLKHVEHDTTYSELAKKVQAEFGFNDLEAEYYTEAIMKKVLLDM